MIFSSVSGKTSLHWMHLYGFYPVCIVFHHMVFKIIIMHFLLQCVYLNGFSPLGVKWILPTVYSLMTDKMHSLNKNFITQISFERLFPTMHSLVNFKITFSSKPLITMITFKRLFPAVCSLMIYNFSIFYHILITLISIDCFSSLWVRWWAVSTLWCVKKLPHWSHWKTIYTTLCVLMTDRVRSLNKKYYIDHI